MGQKSQTALSMQCPWNTYINNCAHTIHNIYKGITIESRKLAHAVPQLGSFNQGLPHFQIGLSGNANIYDEYNGWYD